MPPRRKRSRTQDIDGTNSSPAVSRASSPGPSKSLNEREKFEAAYETLTNSDSDVLGIFTRAFILLESHKQTIAAQLKAWTSKVYEHYKMPPEIVHSGNDVRYVFVCKRYL